MRTSQTQTQPEFGFFADPPGSPNVEWFVSFLEGRDWITAGEILAMTGRAPSENEKRKIRALADASEGRVCGHQKGYKLTSTMTHEEYQWWRNEALKGIRAVEARIVETDRVFYARKAA